VSFLQLRPDRKKQRFAPKDGIYAQE